VQVTIILNEHWAETDADPQTKMQPALDAAVQQIYPALDRDRTIDRRDDVPKRRENAVADNADDVAAAGRGRWLDQVPTKVVQADHGIDVVVLDQPTIGRDIADQHRGQLAVEAVRPYGGGAGLLIGTQPDVLVIHAGQQQRVPGKPIKA
jgi:hypothetical protein